jgi:serine phosphatase RsbU (regulator of sigma subunit)
LPAKDLLGTIVEEIRQFSPGEQYDDITLIVARSTADAKLAQPSLPLS